MSHVSDIVGPTGTVYAVEFSHRSGRDLVEMSKRRPNIVPIVNVCSANGCLYLLNGTEVCTFASDISFLFLSEGQSLCAKVVHERVVVGKFFWRI